MQINPWNYKKAEFTGPLADDKASLQRQIDGLTRRYSQTGGVIHVCRPAIAAGNEMPASTRSMIRQGH